MLFKSALFKVSIISILLLILLIKCYDIEARTYHYDESGNYILQDTINSKGYYDFNSRLYHGPIYFYILNIWTKIFKNGIKGTRVATVFLSLLLPVLVFTINDLSFIRKVVISLIISLTPALSYYTRYAIHETLFIVFQMLSILGVFSILRNKEKKGIILILTGLFGSILTKETWVLFYGILLLSILPLFNPWKVIKKNLPLFLSTLFIGFIIILYIYSGFFKDSDGLYELVKSIGKWVNIGTGEKDHIKPFYYYIFLMLRYEVLVIPAIFISLFLYKDGKKELKLLLHLTILSTFVYSVIPYKTPWLILSILIPGYMLVGYIISTKIITPRNISLTVLMFITLFISIKINFIEPNSSTLYYNYSPTSRDLKKLIENINSLENPEDVKIFVSTKERMPLSGILLDYKYVIFTDGVIPLNFYEADIFIIDREDEGKINNPQDYIKIYGDFASYYKDVIFLYNRKVFKKIKI